MDTKYFVEMLNNSGKIPNTTINRQVDYIQTNFFKIEHKKRKIFGLDSLSRRKWYSGDLSQEEFNDRMDNKGEDITLRKENPEENALLEFRNFIEKQTVEKDFTKGVVATQPEMT